MQRIERHPILEIEHKAFFPITVDGVELMAREGETIAATLIAHGIRAFRRTEKFREPRGIFCGIGQCTDCIMTVNGKANVKTCVTRVEPGMVVQTQIGHGTGGQHEGI